MTFSHVLLLTFPFSPLLWPPHDPSDKPVSSHGAVLLQPNEFPFHFANVIAPGDGTWVEQDLERFLERYSYASIVEWARECHTKDIFPVILLFFIHFCVYVCAWSVWAIERVWKLKLGQCAVIAPLDCCLGDIHLTEDKAELPWQGSELSSEADRFLSPPSRAGAEAQAATDAQLALKLQESPCWVWVRNLIGSGLPRLQ